MKIFFYKKINNLFKKNIQFLTLLNTNENKFEEITKIILDPEFLNYFKDFINYLFKLFYIYRYKSYNFNTNTNHKKILSIFLIINHKSIILQNKTQYNETLYILSQKIATIINKIIKTPKIDMNLYIHLIFNIDLFIYNYDLWEILDKRINTYKLLIDYYNNQLLLVQLDKNSPNYNVLLESLDNDRHNILKHVKYMNSLSEIKYFNTHKNNIKHNKFINNELYWININYELSKKDYDTNLIVYLLEKTKYLLKQCIPNRTDLHTIIDTNIDSDFIKHYLDNDIIDNRFFNNVMKFIINKIKEFQARNDDNCFDLFVNCIYNDIKNNIEYKNLLPKFFKEIFKRLETIISDRNIFLENFN